MNHPQLPPIADLGSALNKHVLAVQVTERLGEAAMVLRQLSSDPRDTEGDPR